MRDDDQEMDFGSAEKRAHHNALERKRRDHIKDSFSSLKEALPTLQGEKVASRAQILKKAADYIQYMRKKNAAHQQDIEDLKRQNCLLAAQIKSLEKAKSSYDEETDDDDSFTSSSDSDVLEFEPVKSKKFKVLES